MARWYIRIVIGAAALLLVTRLPIAIPHALPFVGLLALALLASSIKILLPLPNARSTMSLSSAVELATLLIAGVDEAMLIALASGWWQCTIRAKERNPVHRTLFSMAALAITVQAAGLAYVWLGGVPGRPAWPALVKPLAGAGLVYFVSNTVLVAAAIALTIGERLRRVWHDNFLWSAPGYFISTAVAGLVALNVDRVDFWLLPLAALPLYLTYRAYRVYLGRVDAERRHAEEVSRLHEAAMGALALARRSEQALAEEKQRLDVTLQSIAEGVISTDTDDRVVLLNKVAEALTGWTPPAAKGRPLREVVPDLAENDLSDESSLPEIRLRKGPDGRERFIDWRGKPIRDAEGHIAGRVVVFRDVTEEVKLEEERLKASKLASLAVLAGGIAHDFNNLLTVIMGNLSLARLSAPVDVDTRAALAEAEAGCIRARELTQQLLTFSKGGAPVKQPTSVAELVQESARFALRGSNVRCELSIPQDVAWVEADAGQISQVIQNLVINAQQAMPAGGIVRIAAETTEVAPGGGLRLAPGVYVRISVADRGIGIPPDHLPKIFDPYFTTKQKGSGLGLATAYSIVTRHDGRLLVDSRLGEGTTVSLYLPAAAAQPAARRERRDEAPAGGKGRVLVMDDEDTIRALAARMLSRLGYEYELARDGADAIARYQAARAAGQPFDLVVMDLTVPGGMGGHEAVGRLLQIDPAVRAVVSSGYSDDAVMADFRAHGFRGMVPKPFTIHQLGAALRDAMQAARRAA